MKDEGKRGEFSNRSVTAGGKVGMARCAVRTPQRGVPTSRDCRLQNSRK
jgi:hypothetical protein